jgi:hypothetical protein
MTTWIRPPRRSLRFRQGGFIALDSDEKDEPYSYSARKAAHTVKDRTMATERYDKAPVRRQPIGIDADGNGQESPLEIEVVDPEEVHDQAWTAWRSAMAAKRTRARPKKALTDNLAEYLPDSVLQTMASDLSRPTSRTTSQVSQRAGRKAYIEGLKTAGSADGRAHRTLEWGLRCVPPHDYRGCCALPSRDDHRNFPCTAGPFAPKSLEESRTRRYKEICGKH